MNLIKLLTARPMTNEAILVMRLFFGLTMVFSHGWGKMLRLLDGDTGFANIFGMGEPLSLTLAVFAEVLCGVLIAFGLFTRFAAIPLIITMMVAVFIVHGDDPFSKQEFGLMYLMAYVAILLTGPGKYSLDQKLFGYETK